MSVVVCGESDRTSLLASYLLHYAALCDGLTAPASDQKIHDLTITNKYYTALVRLHSLALGEALNDEVEGFIVVPTASQTNLASQLYAACHSAVEADVGLRLLVAISDEREQHSEEATRHYEEWAIDNGFEYIEIVAPHITKGHQDREKFGLPRLMEALESNMWSTMQRRAAAGSSSSSSSSSASAARSGAAAVDAAAACIPGSGPAEDAEKASEQPQVAETIPAVVDTSVPEATARDAETAQAFAAGTEKLSGLLGEGQEPLADAEENEMFDKYAGFISEVKDLRELAVKGEMSDSARRDAAAAMATKLMQMFALDDESDSEADA